MPEAEEHNKLLRALGLEGYEWVNELMDSNRGVFPAPVHRLMPPHDPLSGIALALFRRDVKALAAHVAHNLQDLLSDPGWPIHMADRLRRSARRALRALRGGGRG